MKDTLEARLILCALTGVLSLLTLNPPVSAADREALFRGSITSTGELKDGSGKIVGKVEMDSAGNYDALKMTIRQDGAVISADGRVVGRIQMSLAGASPQQKSTAVSNPYGLTMVRPPLSTLPNSWLDQTRPPLMQSSSTGMAPIGPGKFVPIRSSLSSVSGTGGPQSPLRGRVASSAQQESLNPADRLASIMGGLNTPGQFPDTGLNATDDLTMGQEANTSQHTLGGLNTRGRYPDISIQPTDSVSGGIGGIESPHLMAGADTMSGSAVNRGSPSSQQQHIAGVLGGLNTPGAYPDIAMMNTENADTRSGLSAARQQLNSAQSAGLPDSQMNFQASRSTPGMTDRLRSLAAEVESTPSKGANAPSVNQTRGRDLAVLKRNTQARVDASLADGTLTHTQAALLGKNINKARALEVQYVRNGFSRREQSDLIDRWDGIMNDLVDFVRRNTRQFKN